MLMHRAPALRENRCVERFQAPWAVRLRIATAAAVVVLLGMPFAMYLAQPEKGILVPVIFGIVAGVGIPLGALFSIRGYRLDERGLHVERLMWSDRIPLDELRRAWADHEATVKSMRLFGNSGFFCIAGFFTNRKLGRYRAFATDPVRAVVLELPKRRIVVTPDDPWAFQAALRRFCPTAEIGTKPAS